MVQAMVHFDSLQPVPKRGSSFKAVQPEKHLHHDFLGEVFGVVWIVRKIPAIGNDPFLVTKHELLKRS
jgi:hypothetical protein